MRERSVTRWEERQSLGKGVKREEDRLGETMGEKLTERCKGEEEKEEEREGNTNFG